MTQVRAAALSTYDIVARFLGLDPDAMLREFGIDPALLADPEQPLPLADVAPLLEESAARSGCAQFGLLMAESRSLGSLGPAALLLKHQPDAGAVIHAVVRHQRAFGLALELSEQWVGDLLLVRAELHGAPAARQAIEYLVGYACRCIVAVVGRGWSPESVHFTHAAPADLTVHRRLFACPIEFDSAFNGIACDRAAVAAVNPSADRELALHAEQFFEQLAPDRGVPTARELAMRSLRLLLPEHRGTLDQVALNLATTPRTLQRLLEREGCTFGELLDEIRRELAQRHLAEPTRQVAAVAELVGYRTPSSFTRWFTAEFGLSPAAWRAQARQGDAAPEEARPSPQPLPSSRP
jgi:AraC-like DNA-binding protein